MMSFIHPPYREESIESSTFIQSALRSTIFSFMHSTISLNEGFSTLHVLLTASEQLECMLGSVTKASQYVAYWSTTVTHPSSLLTYCEIQGQVVSGEERISLLMEARPGDPEFEINSLIFSLHDDLSFVSIHISRLIFC